MLRHKNIDRICLIALAATLLLALSYMGAAAMGLIGEDTTQGYEARLFDTSMVHTIDIAMADWDAFLDTCTNEEYATCTVTIDGEPQGTVAIRAKGNTSLSSVASYGNDRYSFKIEFDHYETGKSYYGLDKLSLNNLIQDNTYLKDYVSYTLMGKMGVAAPLCSFAQITVNGEVWGLYLAVEGVEDSFLERNYGASHGELYKPDSMSLGGGRGAGQNFNMDEIREQFEEMFGDTTSEEGEAAFDPSTLFGGNFANFDPTQMMQGGVNPFSSNDSAGGTTDSAEAPSAPSMPEGFDPAQMTQGGDATFMENFTPTQMMQSSDATSRPEGFDPAQMMQGGFNPFSFGDSVSFSEASPGEATALDMSEDFDSSAISERFSRGNGGGMGGGFGGMGSSDVMLQYIDDDPSSYSNIFNNAKTDISQADQQRLIASLKTLSEGEDVSSVVDEEAVIRYFVVHNFLCNDDSYTGTIIHNYYLYEENGELAMIPWDYNLAFGGMGMGGFGSSSGATSTVNSPIDSPVSSGDISTRPMVSWIFEDETYTERYHEIYAEFMETAFDSGWLAEHLQSVIEMISPYVESDPTAFCSYEEFETGSASLLEFCLLRSESVSGQLGGTIPSTTEAQRTQSSTLIDASHLDLSALGSMGNMGGGGGGFGGHGMGSENNSFDRSSMRGGRLTATSPDTGAANSTGARIPQTDSANAMFEASPSEAVQADAMPEGFDPSQMTQSNMGGASGMPSIPEGFDPSQMMQGDMGDASGMPSMPEGFDPSQTMQGDMGTASGMPSTPALDDAASSAEVVESPASDAPAEQPEASADPSAESSDRSRMSRSVPTDFDPSSFRSGMSGSSTTSTETWILLGGCAVVLILAIIIAKRYKANR